jgi:hypothetical protein
MFTFRCTDGGELLEESFAHYAISAKSAHHEKLDRGRKTPKESQFRMRNQKDRKHYVI